MISSWEMYWILTLDSINKIVGMGLVLSSIAILIGIAIVASEWADENDNFLKFGKTLINKVKFIFFACILLYTFLPSTKQMFAIKVIPAVVDNEDVKEMPSLAVKAAKKWLLEKLEAEDGE